MPVVELDRLLLEAGTEVIETMFFATVVGASAAGISAPSPLSAHLDFRGNLAGRFGVCLPWEAARSIAAGFLALEEEEVSRTQIAEVVCELANMICGSVLSRLEEETPFQLSRPALDSGSSDSRPAGRRVAGALELDEGILQMSLEWEQA